MKKIKADKSGMPKEKKKALSTIKEITETIDSQQKSNVDVNQMMLESKNEWEKAYATMIGKLFDKESLKMISRLNNQLTYYIVKHLLVLNWYAEYWNKLEVKFSIIKTDKPPYWKRHIEYIGDSKLLEKYNTSYERFINELLMLTISQDGKGRAEILDAIHKSEGRYLENQMLGGRLGQALNKFGIG